MSETIKVGPEYLDKMAEALSKYPQQNPSSLVVDNSREKISFISKLLLMMKVKRMSMTMTKTLSMMLN